jgi:hypothetical protein
MPRKRTPSPELTAQDKLIIDGFTTATLAIADRHGSAELKLAAKLMLGFIDEYGVQPKPRTRKPKVAPASTTNVFVADGVHAE